MDPAHLDAFITHVNTAGTIASGTLEKIVDYTGDVVTCSFSSAISTGEQVVLQGLAGSFIPPVIIGTAISGYDALVATDGSGDYLKPSAAFAAGATTVYVRAGTYVEFTDVVIPNYGVMVGETVAPVVLYFAGPFGVRVDGSGGVKETAGTISVVSGSATVTGTGSSFTNVPPGCFILLDQNYYQVAAISSDTSLTLADAYQGRALVDHEFVMQPMYTGINVSNLIIYNSAATGLYLRAIRSSVFNVVGCMMCNVGLEMVDASTNAFTTVNCFDNTTHGVVLTNTYSVGFVNGEMYNNGANGVQVAGDSNNVVLNGVLVANNNGTGVDISGTVSKTLVNDCVIQRNNGKGLATGAGTGSAIIDGSMLLYNGGDGIDFNGHDNIISNCDISRNGGHGVQAGDNGTVTGCHVYDNTLHGINLTGDSDCRISGNNVYGNGDSGIVVTGDRNVIQGNSVRTSVASGILVSGGGVDNAINGNHVSGNTGQGIRLVGTCRDTLISDNRVHSNSVGIEIPAGCDDCVVSGNSVTGSSGDGISVDANDCIVTGNRSRGNTGAGCVIVSSGASTNTVKINRFTGNTGADFTDNGTGTIKDL